MDPAAPLRRIIATPRYYLLACGHQVPFDARLRGMYAPCPTCVTLRRAEKDDPDLGEARA